MELVKNPETEMEYFEIIEGLGGFAWRMDHDLADGRVEDKTGGMDRDIQDARKISATLVSELKEKFGVIPPKECPKVEPGKKASKAPKGKIYYWDWYEKMKNLSQRIYYEKIICSACPFSGGVKKMIEMGGDIPCRKIHGILYRLGYPFECHLISFKELTPGQLYQEIMKKGGEVALTRFKIKEAGLKAVTVDGEVKF